MKENEGKPSEHGIKNHYMRNLKLCMDFTTYVSPKIRIYDICPYPFTFKSI